MSADERKRCRFCGRPVFINRVDLTLDHVEPLCMGVLKLLAALGPGKAERRALCALCGKRKGKCVCN